MSTKDQKYHNIILKNDGTYSIYVSEEITLNFEQPYALGEYIEKQNKLHISALAYDSKLFKKEE